MRYNDSKPTQHFLLWLASCADGELLADGPVALYPNIHSPDGAQDDAISEAPAKVREFEAEKARLQGQLDRLQELQPTYVRLGQLHTHLLPAAQQVLTQSGLPKMECLRYEECCKNSAPGVCGQFRGDETHQDG